MVCVPYGVNFACGVVPPPVWDEFWANVANLTNQISLSLDVPAVRDSGHAWVFFFLLPIAIIIVAAPFTHYYYQSPEHPANLWKEDSDGVMKLTKCMVHERRITMCNVHLHWRELPWRKWLSLPNFILCVCYYFIGWLNLGHALDMWTYLRGMTVLVAVFMVVIVYLTYKSPTWCQVCLVVFACALWEYTGTPVVTISDYVVARTYVSLPLIYSAIRGWISLLAIIVHHTSVCFQFMLVNKLYQHTVQFNTQFWHSNCYRWVGDKPRRQLTPFTLTQCRDAAAPIQKMLDDVEASEHYIGGHNILANQRRVTEGFTRLMTLDKGMKMRDIGASRDRWLPEDYISQLIHRCIPIVEPNDLSRESKADSRLLTRVAPRDGRNPWLEAADLERISYCKCLAKDCPVLEDYPFSMSSYVFGESVDDFLASVGFGRFYIGHSYKDGKIGKYRNPTYKKERDALYRLHFGTWDSCPVPPDWATYDARQEYDLALKLIDEYFYEAELCICEGMVYMTPEDGTAYVHRMMKFEFTGTMVSSDGKTFSYEQILIFEDTRVWYIWPTCGEDRTWLSSDHQSVASLIPNNPYQFSAVLGRSTKGNASGTRVLITRTYRMEGEDKIIQFRETDSNDIGAQVLFECKSQNMASVIAKCIHVSEEKAEAQIGKTLALSGSIHPQWEIVEYLPLVQAYAYQLSLDNNRTTSDSLPTYMKTWPMRRVLNACVSWQTSWLNNEITRWVMNMFGANHSAAAFYCPKKLIPVPAITYETETITLTSRVTSHVSGEFVSPFRWRGTDHTTSYDFDLCPSSSEDLGQLHNIGRNTGFKCPLPDEPAFIHNLALWRMCNQLRINARRHASFFRESLVLSPTQSSAPVPGYVPRSQNAVLPTAPIIIKHGGSARTPDNNGVVQDIATSNVTDEGGDESRLLGAPVEESTSISRTRGTEGGEVTTSIRGVPVYAVITEQKIKELYPDLLARLDEDSGAHVCDSCRKPEPRRKMLLRSSANKGARQKGPVQRGDFFMECSSGGKSHPISHYRVVLYAEPCVPILLCFHADLSTGPLYGSYLNKISAVLAEGTIASDSMQKCVKVLNQLFKTEGARKSSANAHAGRRIHAVPNDELGEESGAFKSGRVAGYNPLHQKPESRTSTSWRSSRSNGPNSPGL